MRKHYANEEAREWLDDVTASPENFPFSFTYNGRKINGFPDDLFEKKSVNTERAPGKETTVTDYGFEDGLNVSLIVSFYPDYGVSEWTVEFENRGDTNSGIISDMYSSLEFPVVSPSVHGILGDHVNQYRPYVHDLAGGSLAFLSESGRPTHVYFPYFDLRHRDGGCFLAIGWAGTWSADFSYSDGIVGYTARSTVGLNTYLGPGEKIRSALFVRAPYALPDEHYATNFWRSWFVNCNLPAAGPDGRHAEPFSTCCIANDTGLPNSDGSISERSTTWRPSLEKMIAENAKVDFRWFDAGWYEAPDGSSPVSDWWGTVGTWKLDPVKWPGDSFLESTEFARQNGMRTLMWFEPERVTDPDSLVKYHGYKKEWAIRREGHKGISNNIGDPECYRWTLDRICSTLRGNKVEMYREDNNSDPGELWRYLDTFEGEDRAGITENKFVMAHYAMWDDIIACTLGYGGCGFVDSCAGGGGRNDLESLRRGIPLLRSDADRTTTALRLSMTTSFNRYIPFSGACTKEKASELAPTGVSDTYTWRASYLAALNVDQQFVCDKDQNFDSLRFGLSEWKRVAPYLLKDFYVLTEWHDKNDKKGFTSFAYFDDDIEKGCLFIFRMEDCEEKEITLRLPFADAGREYFMTDADDGEKISVPGKMLADDGVTFVLNRKRSSRLIFIEHIAI